MPVPKGLSVRGVVREDEPAAGRSERCGLRGGEAEVRRARVQDSAHRAALRLWGPIRVQPPPGAPMVWDQCSSSSSKGAAPTGRSQQAPPTPPPAHRHGEWTSCTAQASEALVIPPCPWGHDLQEALEPPVGSLSPCLWAARQGREGAAKACSAHSVLVSAPGSLVLGLRDPSGTVRANFSLQGWGPWGVVSRAQA